MQAAQPRSYRPDRKRQCDPPAPRTWDCLELWSLARTKSPPAWPGRHSRRGMGQSLARLAVPGVLYRNGKVLGGGVERYIGRIDGAVIQLAHLGIQRDDIRGAVEVAGNPDSRDN